ncbi:hypothetical protein Mzhil_0571 [Methanosalsum zhilinae DSM 4017]|uniref:Uncharacterized protein n=1 Tax=Methanosalsum zhilinae (strain DSM 4017 / NBRC 107636 / OCM 62 / WeN5) TaxID=679901 RepID=F7XQ74_METZD|nr:hypothetical protein [Methanosalsum zhilinae]AEH60438.1 hypothetical protein Mzhil_0571 [Methanosalsum zhilinae DSM 4017]
MVNIDNSKLRTRLLKYFSKYNVQSINVHSLASEPSVDECCNDIEEITRYLIVPIETNIKKELAQLFKECENPEIPYFEVVMDIMQFMNDFVGDPHTVEMMFGRINNEVARKKMELDEKKFYPNEEWTAEVADAAIQKLRSSGTERDYELMIDKIVQTLVHSGNKNELKNARMKLNDIIKKHSNHELRQLDEQLFG